MGEQSDQGMVSRVGPLEIDWPRTVGYYGGIGVAVAFGVIYWPVGIFIAAIPFFKLLDRPNASFPERTIGQVLEGAALPVGGDSPSAIRTDGGSGSGPRLGNPVAGLLGRARAETASIWRDAQRLR